MKKENLTTEVKVAISFLVLGLFYLSTKIGFAYFLIGSMGFWVGIGLLIARYKFKKQFSFKIKNVFIAALFLIIVGILGIGTENSPNDTTQIAKDQVQEVTKEIQESEKAQEKANKEQKAKEAKEKKLLEEKLALEKKANDEKEYQAVVDKAINDFNNATNKDELLAFNNEAYEKLIQLLEEDGITESADQEIWYSKYAPTYETRKVEFEKIEEEQRITQQEQAKQTTIVYVTGGGTSEVYWYSTARMPSNTNMSNVVQMTEAEAIELGKRPSRR
ncbi:MAG: hypothetical protein LBV67_04715 [Streptococcaceae bacterium]|jgi:hypothetical protein|nr:hypothetical protein [Streptococcaceae bacterium]